jgi:L-fuculose-phosphate aldolase
VRIGDGFLVTPSGMACDALVEADLVEVTPTGEPRPGPRRPSSEWPLHLEVYRHRADVAAVVHAHPVFATTIACLREDLPAVHYMLAISGAAVVRCAEYATFGTVALARNAVAALQGSQACLLANHGLVAVGGGIDAALRVATEVEAVAELAWRARQVGTPVILDDTEMARVLEKFRGYLPD